MAIDQAMCTSFKQEIFRAFIILLADLAAEQRPQLALEILLKLLFTLLAQL
jgi:hypothetical protein